MDATLDVSAHAKEYAALGVGPVRHDGRPAAPRTTARIRGRDRRGRAREDARRALLSARRQRLPPARRRGVEGELGGAELRVRGARVRHRGLRGYKDYVELLALWDHRDEPFHLRACARSWIGRATCTLTVDARGCRHATPRCSRSSSASSGCRRARWWCSTSPPATCWRRSGARRGRASIAAASDLDEDAARPDLPLLDRVRYGQHRPARRSSW